MRDWDGYITTDLPNEERPKESAGTRYKFQFGADESGSETVLPLRGDAHETEHTPTYKGVGRRFTSTEYASDTRDLSGMASDVPKRKYGRWFIVALIGVVAIVLAIIVVRLMGQQNIEVASVDYPYVNAGELRLADAEEQLVESHITESSTKTLSEHLAEPGTHIWMMTSWAAVDKNNKPDYFYVFKDGDVWLYFEHVNYSIDDALKLTFGDVAEMTDDELIQHLQNYYYEKKTDGYHLTIKTDSTGNNTREEYVWFDGLDSSYLGARMATCEATETWQVFDTFFGGYTSVDPAKYGDGNYSRFVTKCAPNAVFELDQRGAPGVTAD